MLVQSQRSISCWVAPNTYPYLGSTSSNFLELLKKNRIGPSLQYFDLLPTYCMRSSHEDCSNDHDNYLLQVWMSCHRVCPLNAVLFFALLALMLLLLMPLLWIVLLLCRHIVRPKLVLDEKDIGDAAAAPPPARLLMTLQRSPHSAVADDKISRAWPSTFIFVWIEIAATVCRLPWDCGQ